MRTLLFASVLVALAAPAAFADPTATPDVQKMVGDDCARARKANKTCVLDMGTENVDGDKPVADGLSHTLIVFGGSPSLVRARMDFIPEILRTAEDLD
jgi:hypothetical protein